MTTEVKVSKGQYHLVTKMVLWLVEIIGPGKWTYATPETWEGLDEYKWASHEMFGTTTFAFKNEADAAMFILKWK